MGGRHIIMVPVVDDRFFLLLYSQRCISRMEHGNWTELALNDSKGIAAPFGAKSKS